MRIVIISIISITINGIIYCQSDFQLTIGSDKNETGSVVKVGNNYLVVGSTFYNNSEDIYVALVDESFKAIWSKSFGTSSDDRGKDLVGMSNGNLLVSGFSDNGLTSLYFEVDTAGQIIRSFKFGSFHDRLQQIIKTNDNGILIYGELEGAIPGHNKVALLKYDYDLNIEWKYFYDYTNSTDYHPDFEMYNRKVLQLEDSSYVILGNYTQLGNSSNNRKIRLIKVDKDGDQEWVKGYHGGRMDSAAHVNLCADGGFIISTTSNSYNNSDRDILLIKTDMLGNPQWQKTYGTQGQESAGQVMQLSNGDF